LLGGLAWLYLYRSRLQRRGKNRGRDTPSSSVKLGRSLVKGVEHVKSRKQRGNFPLTCWSHSHPVVVVLCYT
jgi:hypothetical protein